MSTRNLFEEVLMIRVGRAWLLIGLVCAASLWGCSGGIADNPLTTPSVDDHPTAVDSPVSPTEEVYLDPTNIPIALTEEVDLDPTNTPITKTTSPSSQADIMSISVSGGQEAFTFSVTVSSPDEGCDRYADWWEVVSPDGELIYRRVLLHSHVNEQPFTRSGGPVPIKPDEVVWVRAHMNPDGYGGTAMQGSVAKGFEAVELDADYAPHLAETPPLPSGCNF
jgi:hypothetical protein